jgi:hypothetical protein
VKLAPQSHREAGAGLPLPKTASAKTVEEQLPADEKTVYLSQQAVMAAFGGKPGGCRGHSCANDEAPFIQVPDRPLSRFDPS